MPRALAAVDVRVTRRARGLVVWFKFEGNANDSSGLGNNGTLNGAPAFITGKVGQAIDLDGVDDYVRVPYNASFKPASQVSVAAWVKPDVVTGSGVIVENTGGSGGTMVSRSGANLGFTKDHSNAELVASGVFTAGQWHHVVCTYDGAEERIYVNGVLRASRAQTGAVPTANEPLYVGARQGSSVFFDGAIDEVRLSDRALTPDDVYGLYANGAETYRDENSAQPPQVVLGGSVRLTESVGVQEGNLLLDNTGGRFNGLVSGDTLAAEALGLDEGTHVTLLDGVIGRLVYEPGNRPTVQLQILGWNFLLDLINITADKEYQSTAYTSIADDLATTHLSGWTRSITADAAAPAAWKVSVGMKLREALDQVRRALIAATGNKWEYELIISSGTKTFRWFVRDTTSVGPTVKLEDLQPGSRREPGGLLEVINRAVVVGATVPAKFRDKRSLTKAGTVRLDATTERVAQPFIADASPLYSGRWKGDRSTQTAPPTLKAFVARNSDNKDHVGLGANVFGTRLRAPNCANPENIDDDNLGTGAAYNGADDSTYRELVVWDLGASPPGVEGFLWQQNSHTSQRMRIESSDDDSVWTTEADDVDTSAPTVTFFASTKTKRYWRISWKSTQGATNRSLTEFHLLRYKNSITPDAGTAGGIYRNSPTTNPEQHTTGGTVTEPCWRFNFRAAVGVAKVEWRHSESNPSSLLTLEVRKSSDGATFSAVAVLPSTSTAVTDTIYVEDAAFQYLDGAVVDARAGGSANNVTTSEHAHVFLHTSTWGKPLTGDRMTASDLSWTRDDLVQRPGEVVPKTYGAPNLALTADGYYWQVYEPQSGAGATSWWELDYGTEAYLTAALISTDSGTSWSSVAANAVLLHRVEFNNAAITSQSDDATSQSKYAGVVPGGVIAGGISDPTITTKDMADREAGALTSRRGDVRERYTLVVPYHGAYVPGKRCTVDREVIEALGGTLASGTTTTLDVVEVEHRFGPKPTTTLYINEHPLTAGAALEETGSLASGRRA